MAEEEFKLYLEIAELSPEEIKSLAGIRNTVLTHINSLAKVVFDVASKTPELREVIEENKLSKKHIAKILEDMFELALMNPQSRDYAIKMRKAGLAHAANYVPANYLTCIFFRLLSEVVRVIGETEEDAYSQALVIGALCKVLGIGLALMISSYENVMVEALGSKPGLLKTILKVYARNLLQR